MSQNNNKSDSGTPSGAGDTAAAKTDSTASGKAAARKKQHQLKNQKANPPAKKKQQQQPVKSTFEGNASGVNPMKGIVIAQGNGNMAGQFRVFQTKLAGAAAEAYGLDSAILDLIAKKRTDFVKPKPDPSIHSNLVPEVDAAGDPTGGYKLVCFNPALKEQMDAEYNMDLKFQSSNWNQYSRMEEGYYRTAIGNIDSDVITYCRMDKRMTMAESNKDLVLLLLVLRSVCAQNHGAVKVDNEFHNLTTVHSAVGFKQKKSVNNAEFAKEVLDRYGSAIFTSGKFVFGQAVYDKVLSNYTTPMTFKEYINLTDAEQEPIDKIVKERTVARLIIKNSSNDRARNELLETYSVNNNTCYPNTVSEALSLLATFKKQTSNNANTKAEEDVVVSYHETIESYDDHPDDITSMVDDVITNTDDITSDTDDDIIIHDSNDIIEDSISDAACETTATVMAAVIAEATAEANQDQFFGVSFEQLQDVEDAYEDNEPDVVCSAHIADIDKDIICGAHIIDTGAADNIHPANIKRREYPNPHREFELIMYHTGQRINNKTDVYTVNYDPSQPGIISYEYDSPCAESIIDYSDAMRLKLKLAGIHDSTDLMSIFENHTDVEAAAIFKRQLNDVDQSGLKTSTVRILKEETIRHLSHANFNQIRYDRMMVEIGADVELKLFPTANALMHHVVSAVAINQRRHKPNRWVNKVTQKLISCGVNTIASLETKLNTNSLNDHIGGHQPVSVNRVTEISTTEATKKVVNDIGENENQPEGIEFADINGRITLDDFVDNNNDDDSNASDDDFEMDKEYQDELDGEAAMEEEEGIIGNDDPDMQEDYFQTPIQQHNNNVNNNNEPASVIIQGRNRSDTNPVVSLGNVATPKEKQECAQQKKKKKEVEFSEENAMIDDDESDVNTIPNNDNAQVGVDTTDNTIDDSSSIPKELDSDLGPYWNLDQSKEAYVLNTITSYNNIEASKSTPQYGFNRGLKEFGSLGYEATVKELDDNLLGMGAVQMLQPSKVSRNIRYEALNYLMFLKRKRCGKVKARGCADGRPQREYISKDESSSPTVSIYALMTSCLMDAIEERKVATCDIPGAFLQADWPADRDCYLKFEGAMVSMICDIDPKYKKNIVHSKNGKKYICAKLTKAVYGTLLGAILFYEKLSKQLVDWGYEANCYDRCTFNKMIDGSQITIQFHVDDLKISHKEQSVIDSVLMDLNNTFGTTKKPLAATTGDIHDYLGLTIDFSEKGTVKFTMYDYLEDILSEMPADMKGTSPTPANDRLFDAEEESPPLNEKEADFFHRTTARLLFAAKRARPDLQVAVAYLCTRVKSPNQSDYRKLTRVIKYLRLTIFIPLVLGWDGTGHMTWSVDASFAVHKDMRSHTGAVLTMGQGALMSMSLKQKINTKSSTEAELVGVDDAMNFVEWIQLFVEQQTKSLNDNSVLKKIGCDTIIQQDNTSTIQLENNGKQSSTKRTRHINIRYFYVTSKIKDGSMRVIYHPTKQMVSDYLTKPLQGALFRTHRNSIMGHSEDSISRYRKEYSDAKIAIGTL